MRGPLDLYRIGPSNQYESYVAAPEHPHEASKSAGLAIGREKRRQIGRQP
jgi:hypothetical protein